MHYTYTQILQVVKPKEWKKDCVIMYVIDSEIYHFNYNFIIYAE